MLAAWQEVEATEDFSAQLGDSGEQDPEMIYAAIEHASASLGRRPSEWPEHLGNIQEYGVIHEQCHYFLRGASLDSYATMEE